MNQKECYASILKTRYILEDHERFYLTNRLVDNLKWNTITSVEESRTLNEKNQI